MLVYQTSSSYQQDFESRVYIKHIKQALLSTYIEVNLLEGAQMSKNIQQMGKTILA